MNHKGIYAIPRTGSLGASVYYTDDDGRTKWLMDVFSGYSVDTLRVSQFSGTVSGDTADILAVAANTSAGVAVELSRLDIMFSSDTITSTDRSFTKYLAPHKMDYQLLTGIDLSYSPTFDLVIRMYYEELSRFYVYTYHTDVAFDKPNLIDISTPSCEVTLSGLSHAVVGEAFGADEEITAVHTIPVRSDSGDLCYDIPVVITTTGVYLVQSEYNTPGTFLFSGDVNECYSQSRNYNSVHFGDGTVMDETYDLASNVFKSFSAPGGILTMSASDTERILINFISITSDIDTFTATADIPAYFLEISLVDVPSPSEDVLTSVDLVSYDPYLINKVGTSLYLRIGHRVVRLEVTDGELKAVQSKVFDSNNFEPVSFAVGSEGNILEIRDNSIYSYSSLEATQETSVLEEGEGYTNAQLYTETVLDQSSIGKEHPILSGTLLDSEIDTATQTLPLKGEYTGSYTSDFGYSFLSIEETSYSGDSVPGSTVVIRGDRAAGVSPISYLPTDGTIVSGADFERNGVRQTILLYNNASALTFISVGYTETGLQIQQVMSTTLGLVGQISSLSNISDSLWVQDATKVYVAEIGSFGIIASGNAEYTFKPVLDITTADWYNRGDVISTAKASKGYYDRLALILSAGERLITYYVSPDFTRLSLALSPSIGVAANYIGSIVGSTMEYFIVWSEESLSIYSTTRTGNISLVSEVDINSYEVVKVSDLAITVSSRDFVDVYHKSPSLTLTKSISGFGVVKNSVIALGQDLLVPRTTGMEVYKWWTGVSPELYYDYNSQDFYVPLYSVDFEDNPANYDRDVLERDERYGEPITVAYDSTNSFRSRQVVSNRRMSFKRETLDSGETLLSPTSNTRKIIRNSALWCLGIDPATLIKSDVTTITDDLYLPSDKVQDADTLSMSDRKVCGNLTHIEEILEMIPDNGILVPGKYLPSGVNSDVFFENKTVKVYPRTVTGTTQLRAEFGEYKGKGSATAEAYETDGYIDTEEGVTSDGFAYLFWNALWDQSVETGEYLSDLLDLREEANGPAKETDLVRYVNPAKILLTHFFADSVITLIRVSPLDGQTLEEAMEEMAIEVDSIPWLHVNKALPSGSKCVTLYVVGTGTESQTQLTPEI